MINSGIYAIFNLINEKLYIGSATDFYKRYHIHKSLLINNKHENSYLQRAWNKYGQINFMFVILEYVDDKNNLEIREQYWLDLIKPYNRSIGYNSRLVANNNTGVKFNEETKSKISKAKTGIKLSEQTKLNMSIASANRNLEKWPCPDKAKCQCEWCKGTRRIRNREHMRQWRAANRERYNKYSRDYRAQK